MPVNIQIESGVGQQQLSVGPDLLEELLADPVEGRLRVDLPEAGICGQSISVPRVGGFGAYQQVGQALRGLVGDGTLVRVGHGLYAKARPSSTSSRPVPVDTLQNLALDIMKKLGIQANLGRDARARREGKSTQVPMAIVINIGKARVRRKITFGYQVVLYEKD